MATPSQRAEHITAVRQRTSALLEAFAALRILATDYKYLDLDRELTDADFVDSNDGLGKEDIRAVYGVLAVLEASLDDFAPALYRVKQ